MESLQEFEFFEELSEDQLMSISGGVDVSSSSPLGSTEAIFYNGTITLDTVSPLGSGKTSADVNTLTLATSRSGVPEVTGTTIKLL